MTQFSLLDLSRIKNLIKLKRKLPDLITAATHDSPLCTILRYQFLADSTLKFSKGALDANIY